MVQVRYLLGSREEFSVLVVRLGVGSLDLFYFIIF